MRVRISVILYETYLLTHKNIICIIFCCIILFYFIFYSSGVDLARCLDLRSRIWPSSPAECFD